jgi:hypothetical protein
LISRYQAIEEVLWPRGFTRDVWMIVDCARDPQGIFRFLLGCHLEYSCLYSGVLPPELEMAAPYLLQLDYDSEETRRLLRLAWGHSWGILLRSGTNMKKLRRHLREFLVIRDPKGKRMAFRYYDPRVLRIYLPTCSSDDLRTFFGPVEHFWTEDASDEDHILQFRIDGGRLDRKSVPLTEFGVRSHAAELVERAYELDDER